MSENPFDEPLRLDRIPGVQQFRRVMVTGHRPQHLTPEEQAWSQVSLMHTAWRFRSVYGTVHGISGLALGADTWWALGVLASGMHLHAHIPFPQQPSKWQPADKAMWAELRRKAKTEKVIADKFSVGALHARNDSMLKDADLVVALFKPGTTGGTAGAVDKATKKGMPMLMLNPTTRKMTRVGW